MTLNELYKRTSDRQQPLMAEIRRRWAEINRRDTRWQLPKRDIVQDFRSDI